ncbi:alanyl-tRNA editing protein [Tropicibacter naphthalenivorans]|uniref:Alanine--tRNA ligase n=1 Tax=Tropicibacter naphthalenivorans TaxID=441103 RepID=A0A0P1GNB8_9RHOB|nr:alanyl-tRNA editing protein [Tropicibacter naphthalenivorans]CUH76821.1 Alanine--tRNA ligase [Tropicibacter naphthalenivorans]SMC62789.1 Ala-tRNA(Pro) hydrolase [Tropicibacter naphthalenivorans]
MSDLLYRDDAYAREAPGRVVGYTDEGGVIVTPCLFYPTGGGQPGDSGWLEWDGKKLPIATAVKGDDGLSVLVPAEPAALPPKGAHVVQVLDWERRHRHMRIHTALHLLSVVIPLPVTGGKISAGTGRLDFMMPEPPEDRDALEAALNDLVDRDLAVSEDWITTAELDANPGLVKTLSVRPPRGGGEVRLVRIGAGAEQVDLQPCGGTHVARTGEIGALRLGRIENKGKQNRRVNIALD